MRKSLVLCLLFLVSTSAIAADPTFSTTLLSASTPGTTVRTAIGDVDRDGRNELVVVSSSASPEAPLRIYSVAADGSVTLEHAVDVARPASAEWTYAQPRLADIDGDGDLDIALYLRADGQGGVLTTALWDETQSRFVVSSYATPETDAAYGFDMADINGDGKADAITANHGANAPQTIFVAHGGAAAFGTFVAHPFPFQGAPGVFGPNQRGIVYVYSRDLDGNGRSDIVASSAPFNSVAGRVLFNNSSGMVVRDLVGGASVDIAIFDATGDGRLDLVTTSYASGGLRTYIGSGFTATSSLPSPPSTQGLVIGDFTRDGRRDFAFVQTLQRNVTIQPGGQFSPVTIIGPDLSAASYSPDGFVQYLAAGDVDNDGALDLVFASDRVVLIRSTAVADTTKPVLSLPANITVEATTPAGAVVTFTATATDDQDGTLTPQCSPASGSTFGLGTRTVNCTATDAAGNTATGSFTVTVRDTTKPVLSLPASITVEATSPAGAVVTFTATATDRGSALTAQCSPASGATFPLGTTTVSCSASDAAGNTATGSFTVTVRDTTAPRITAVSATPAVLGPPNHKMVAAKVTVTATDTGDAAPVAKIIAVSSNQPANTTGDGNSEVDWVITGPLTLDLRAERAANLGDRIYTIVVESRDRFGNASTATTTVTVRK